jgi:methylmalonyl-CoA mutase N-terminal domain/subunit
VNRFTEEGEPPVIASPDYSALERAQVERLARVRAGRNADAFARAMHALRDGAATFVSNDARAQLMPLIIDAVRERASVGEISDVLSSTWGTYRPNT